MFQDTRPAQLDSGGSVDPWSEFRVDHPRERIALLRQLRDGHVTLTLATPAGAMLQGTLWTIDEARARLSLQVDPGNPQLERLVDGDEAVAVAYLDAVKLQFDLNALLLVRSEGSVVLQAALPATLFRFQRRGAFRVRPADTGAPTARLRHPSIPEMEIALRVLDVSVGGCALFLPSDVPPLEPGRTLAQVAVSLDADTRFTTALVLQHVTAIQPGERGVRLGCQWAALDGTAARGLQRYIDQTQKRRRLLTLK